VGPYRRGGRSRSRCSCPARSLWTLYTPLIVAVGERTPGRYVNVTTCAWCGRSSPATDEQRREGHGNDDSPHIRVVVVVGAPRRMSAGIGRTVYQDRPAIRRSDIPLQLRGRVSAKLHALTA